MDLDSMNGLLKDLRAFGKKEQCGELGTQLRFIVMFKHKPPLSQAPFADFLSTDRAVDRCHVTGIRVDVNRVNGDLWLRNQLLVVVRLQIPDMNHSTLIANNQLCLKNDTESWCWTVLVQMPLCACQKRTPRAFSASGLLREQACSVPVWSVKSISMSKPVALENI
ncbi:hypothetical protein F7725_014035 [Dissostichus mawsoni]|uniref:Uncharacterized protein n=1 Tax=Dissostichus mawsoni TaxID=36200 RepID=A0A7J5YVA1_DISMA|nr:hypothetical protein F7725_014035 [Dissostichus mawsoni]